MKGASGGGSGRPQHHQRLFFVFNDIVMITNSAKRVKLILDMKAVDVERGYGRGHPAQGQSNSRQSSREFSLITGITKPMRLVAQHRSDVEKLEQLIEENRHDVWAQDELALESVPSAGSSLRYQLARQLNSIL